MQRENAFNEDNAGRVDGLEGVGNAGVTGEVVYRALNGEALSEGADVFDEEGVVEGVGMVEVLQGALGWGQVAEADVVEVEREQGGVELLREFAGQSGFARARTACYAQDERALREQELLGGLVLHGAAAFSFCFRWEECLL